MKWLGKHIVDLIARFRSDVYLESISTGTIASGAHLGLDSNNKIVKAADGGGDLTSIVAGTGLSGTSLTGPIPTLNVDASQTQITSVGTIGTGSWRGDPIQTAYIGDDQVTEDKLASTLLAEIEANTAKVTNVSTNLAITGSTDAKTITSSDGTNAVIPVATTDVSGVMSTELFDAVTANAAKATNVTTNLTATTHASQITINSSDGTNVVVAEASGSIAGVMSVTHHDKLDAIEASATADQTRSDINGLAITTVGTIDTGVWNGTAIAADQQKHLMHYQVQGYSVGSTNYMLSKNIGSNTAPFKHDVDIGSDGLDSQSVTVWMRTGGHVMPNACTLKRFTGWTETGGSGTAYVGLFKVRLSDDSDTDPSAVLLQEVTYTASGNQIANLFNVTDASGGQSLDLAAGDIIFPAIKGAGNPTYFNGTFEVEF